MMDLFINIIKKAHIIIVIFDLKNRDSFDDVTLWMNYLRDTCIITRPFYILGNYKSEKNIITTKVDIDDMIDKQKVEAMYKEIGNKNTEEIVELLDDLLEMASSEEKNGNVDQSNLNKCILF
jgi:hypothetical protein